MNLFVRLRISKQDKIAANVAQHIRAVRAAEALDRRTRLKRTDSFNFPGLSSTVLPVQRSTSSGEDSPAAGQHEKKRLVGMIKQAYAAEEVIEEIGGNPVEHVACQTSYDLLEALLPSLRKRAMRSGTPDNEDDHKHSSSTPCKKGACYHKRHVYGDGGSRHGYSVVGDSSQSVAYEASSFGTRTTSNCSGRPKSRNRHFQLDDRVEVEYKAQDRESELVDYETEEVISLKDMKKSKALQLLGKKSQYNKLQAIIGDTASLGTPQHEGGVSETSFSPTVSQDSLIDATSSIIEESASTGSDETSGSAVYKNIIINLGGTQDKSGRPFSASQSSTASAANLNLLPAVSGDTRTSRSQENINEGSSRRNSPDVSKWNSPNGNPKRMAM